jgi:hypothetical protein
MKVGSLRTAKFTLDPDEFIKEVSGRWATVTSWAEVNHQPMALRFRSGFY